MQQFLIMTTWVEQHSRWLGRKEGALVVFKILFYHQAGTREHWHITQYDVVCEDTGEDKEISFEQFQQLIAAKRLVNIGEHTKEQWIEMSKR
jgi:hypothetical protein